VGYILKSAGYDIVPQVGVAGFSIDIGVKDSATLADSWQKLSAAGREQANRFKTTTILIEDKSSGAQLIQDCASQCLHAVTRYEPKLEKIMRHTLSPARSKMALCTST
jgi:phage terminase large subunit-like protein